MILKKNGFYSNEDLQQPAWFQFLVLFCWFLLFSGIGLIIYFSYVAIANRSDENGKLNMSEVTYIIFASSAFITLIIALFWIFKKKKKNKN